MKRGGKQKAWRTQAAAVKARMVAEGTHPKGARYGRVVKKLMTRILPVPSFLFQAIALRAGYIQGEQA